MALADLQKLRDQAEMQRKAAVEAAEREYRASLDAINKVQKMLGQNGNASVPTDETPQWPGVRAAVHRALAAMGGDFTLNTMAAHIETHYPGAEANRDTIGGELWKLAKEGEIVVVEKGRGRRPSIYRTKLV